MPRVSTYRGYQIHHVAVYPNWGAYRPGSEQGEPFDLAAISFEEMQAEIDEDVEYQVILEDEG
jgi:hypothetical protein